MSIKCMPSNLSSDIRCAVCGQGFLVFAEHPAHAHDDTLRRTVQNALRQHHLSNEHPAGPFLIDAPDPSNQAFA